MRAADAAAEPRSAQLALCDVSPVFFGRGVMWLWSVSSLFNPVPSRPQRERSDLIPLYRRVAASVRSEESKRILNGPVAMRLQAHCLRTVFERQLGIALTERQLETIARGSTARWVVAEFLRHCGMPENQPSHAQVERAVPGFVASVAARHIGLEGLTDVRRLRRRAGLRTTFRLWLQEFALTMTWWRLGRRQKRARIRVAAEAAGVGRAVERSLEGERRDDYRRTVHRALVAELRLRALTVATDLVTVASGIKVASIHDESYRGECRVALVRAVRGLT